MKFYESLKKIRFRAIRISSFILLFLFISHCTFGSEGNSLTDKKIIIARLALLRDSIKTNANLQILFYDDQGDTKLESFQLNSGINTDIYTVTINDTSKFTFDKIEFYISTTSSSEKDSNESANNVFLHEADSGTVGGTSGTIKIFTTANGYSTSNFMRSNGSDEFGSFSASDNFILTELPQGSLQKVTFHFSSVVLSGTVIGSNKIKNFIVKVSKIDMPFTRLCTTTLGLNQNLNLQLDIKYSNLLKDTTTTSYTTLDNTKILRAIIDLADENPTISTQQNSGIYNEIVKNWNLVTTIKEHRCNK